MTLFLLKIISFYVFYIFIISMNRRALILWSGGREFSWAEMLKKSGLNDLYLTPGNWGTIKLWTNVTWDIKNFKDIWDFVKYQKIDLVVVWPEQPLVDGIVDYFNADKDLQGKIFGPDKAGAQLEWSKAHSKAFMEKYAIPTASAYTVTIKNLDEWFRHIDASTSSKIVLKADGLAAGKWVKLFDDKEEAKEALRTMINGEFGEASAKVLIEDYLEGPEFSVFTITDGITSRVLPPTQDYKRIGEGDTGENTGGMWAISNPPFVTDEIMKQVQDTIITPTIRWLQQEGIVYRGTIYFGLMLTAQWPKVIEYNIRLGDPEAEVVLPHIQSNLYDILKATLAGNLSSISNIEYSHWHHLMTVLAAKWYPDSKLAGERKWAAIHGLDQVVWSDIIHAGTSLHNGVPLVNWGRVLGVRTYGEDIAKIQETNNQNAARIQFIKNGSNENGVYYRTDIGKNASK